MPDKVLLRIKRQEKTEAASYAEVIRNAPAEATAAGVTRDEALTGPAVEVFLHEIGHAVFDMLKVQHVMR
jgi:hypothetical protein